MTLRQGIANVNKFEDKLKMTFHMNNFFCYTLIVAGVLLFTKSLAAEDATPLSGVAFHVLAEGKDASMNGGFATYLGVTKNGARVSMKRIVVPTGSVTNDFYVSIEDKKTIVIVERKSSIDTFYLTDLLGNLKRVVVNDRNIKDGGLTNIPVKKAQAGFQQEKDWWIKKYSQ